MVVIMKILINFYRSWSSHTLTVKDMFVIDLHGVLRVLTVSPDKALVMYDVFASTQVFRIAFPTALESLTMNPGQDLICVGSSNGTIYVVDMTALAIGISASHSEVEQLGITRTAKKVNVPSMFQTTVDLQHKVTASSNMITRPELSTLTTGGLPKGTSILEGHSKAVTSLCFSVDNSTLISASEDGTMRWWDIWTRQCTRDCKPLNKCGITNAMVSHTY